MSQNKMKEILVPVKFAGEVKMLVSEHLSYSEANKLAKRMALCRVQAVTDGPDTPDEDACDDFVAEMAEIGTMLDAHALEDAWDRARPEGVSGKWEIEPDLLEPPGLDGVPDAELAYPGCPAGEPPSSRWRPPVPEPTSRLSVYAAFRRIICDHLGFDAASPLPADTDESVTFEALGADSLDNIEMIMAAEEEFDIDIPEEEEMNMRTIGAALDVVMRLIGLRDAKQDWRRGLHVGDEVTWTDPDSSASCSRSDVIRSIAYKGDVACITWSDGSYVEANLEELS